MKATEQIAGQSRSVAVYAGRDLVGDVVCEARGRYAAVDGAGVLLGIFPSRIAASSALLSEARANAGAGA